MKIAGPRFRCNKSCDKGSYNLSINSEYIGHGKIHMGNGIDLHISHIGHNSFLSNSRVLRLKNLFRVPSIKKSSLCF